MAEAARQVAFAVPGAISQQSGGYIYDRRIVEAMRADNRSVRVFELKGAFPIPNQNARKAASDVLTALSKESVLVIDGLALPAFADLSGDQGEHAFLVALIHHPLALESGLSDSDRILLSKVERALLRRVAGIVTTSTATAALLERYGFPKEKLATVMPGTDRAPMAQGPNDGVPQLLCVANVIPRKGHIDLVTALAKCADLPWRLLCIGSIDRHSETVKELKANIDRFDLSARVTLAGEVDDDTLASAYAGSDIFVLASAFEGYGMAFAEALARGLPIVGSGDGAVRETVPASAGLIVPVGDRGALCSELRRVIGDTTLRARLAKGSRVAGRSLPDWRIAGKAFGKALDRLVAQAA